MNEQQPQEQQTFWESAPDFSAPDSSAHAARDATRETAHAAAKPAAPPSTPRQTLTLKITASAGANGGLSKSQKAFNKLVARVETLRKAIEQKRKHLDAALAYYASTLHPLLLQTTTRRKEILRHAHPFLKAGKSRITDRQRRTLREFLESQLDSIIAIEGSLTDPDIQAIFTELHGMSLAEAEKQEFEQQRATFEQEFDDLGIDIDLSAFHKGMDTDEFMRAHADIAEKLKHAAEDEKKRDASARKKTKAQRAREAREAAIAEARSRSLSSIYKQLARALHPDLERDPDRKAQKLVLMQELTAAYRANDMHTLLRLELEWLQNKETDTARLSEEKLRIYNEVLGEQVHELEREEFMLARDPRYESLAPFAGIFGNLDHFKGENEKKRLTQLNKHLEALPALLQGGNALKELKAMLRQFSEEYRYAFPRSSPDPLDSYMGNPFDDFDDDW